MMIAESTLHGPFDTIKAALTKVAPNFVAAGDRAVAAVQARLQTTAAPYVDPWDKNPSQGYVQPQTQAQPYPGMQPAPYGYGPAAPSRRNLYIGAGVAAAALAAIFLFRSKKA